ncbi:hypothetical protein [Devosia ginsengisoli]|uniref:Uncharacterized protein n=1 Tax=Devosia ginsengisoli TaxID=400770 RepID=A0A5B8LQB7_9HYPH|nr:hypothetical protein [Devosia ginsengisoli]QDZ09380.1 hypothetical protein FPZ08_00635 [Devosia ginsengisoli]
MVIHDDADMATVVGETVQAIKESARHVGKADRAISAVQISEIEAAVEILQKTLELKKRVNAVARS